VHEIHRLVAPVRGLRFYRARQQIGGIGFDHQSIRRSVLHQLVQMGAAAFVAEPAGDADVPVPVQIVEQFLAGAGEAVHHSRAEAAVEVAHHRHEIRMRIALVQEQRLAHIRGELQLPLERLALRRSRGEIAVVIQPAFVIWLRDISLVKIKPKTW
jgi:hypothetical protein